MSENQNEEVKQPITEETPVVDVPVIPPEDSQPNKPSPVESRKTEELVDKVDENQSQTAEQETIDQLRVKLAQTESDRDNYKTGMLAEKGRNRMKELEIEKTPETELPSDDYTDNSANLAIVNDYQSKRADILAENESKILQLNNEQFKTLSRRLKTEEQLLINDATKDKIFVAKKHIQQMIDDTLGYLDYKVNPEKKAEEKLPENNLVPADIGSTKTIRKIASQEPITEDDKQLSSVSGLTPKRIQELKKSGYL